MAVSAVARRAAFSLTVTLMTASLTVGAAAAAQAGPAVSAETTDGKITGGMFDPLVGAFAARVLVADKVAAAKYRGGADGSDLPVDDPVRERQLLRAAADQATAMGMNADHVVSIFKDQIAASKLVQRQLIVLWHTGLAQPPAQRPDLGEIRAELDRITTRILAALRNTQTTSGCPGQLLQSWSSTSRQQGLDPMHQIDLLRTLPSVCTARP